ncbi:hypothetical protein [Vagococcus fluvialis]|uniref:hypothetical protein n=1 Tax=Vagococcus fluvialis TaxID=2738 RepID=UPI0037B26D0B
MKSKAQRDREYMQGLGRCAVDGFIQGINQTINTPINIPTDINPKEPFEFVGRIDGPPLTKLRNQSLKDY